LLGRSFYIYGIHVVISLHSGLCDCAFTISYAIIIDWSTPATYARIYATFGAAAGLGVILGPAAGLSTLFFHQQASLSRGVVIHIALCVYIVASLDSSYRAAFVIAACCSIINICILSTKLPESLHHINRTTTATTATTVVNLHDTNIAVTTTVPNSPVTPQFTNVTVTAPKQQRTSSDDNDSPAPIGVSMPRVPPKVIAHSANPLKAVSILASNKFLLSLSVFLFLNTASTAGRVIHLPIPFAFHFLRLTLLNSTLPNRFNISFCDLYQSAI
jgi:hypothetical protein